MNKTLATPFATLAVAALLLAGCGNSDDDADPAPAPSTSSSPSPTSPDSTPAPTPDAGTVIDMTVDGDTVKPNGDRVKAKVGEPITLNVTSDRKGEIHVHSSPEQELEYGVGETTLKITIETPGVVEVEDHIGDVVIVQLEVS